MKGKFPCPLCKADTDQFKDKKHIEQGFLCNRTLQEIIEISETKRVNEGGINDKDLHEMACGVKMTPQTMEEVIPTVFDALHTLLAIARFVIGLLRRMNLGIDSWSITADLKERSDLVDKKLKSDIQMKFGSFMGGLQLEGNGARSLLGFNNREKLLSLLTRQDDDVKSGFRYITDELRFLCAVVSSKKPKEEFDLGN